MCQNAPKGMKLLNLKDGISNNTQKPDNFDNVIRPIRSICNYCCKTYSYQ